MASVTLSGFNNIDFNAILEAVMTQERQPITRLESQQTVLKQQDTALGQLAGHLSTLQSAAEALSTPTSFDVLKATSSNDSLISVGASSGTTPGEYDVVVTNRARAQVTASASTSLATDVVATGGTLQLLANSQPPVDIVVTQSMTLQQLADAINAEGDAPVSASVVQVSPGSYRLVLTGKQTGADNAFTLTSTLAGGTGVSFADPDTDNIYGETGSNAVEAINASLTVNNVPVSSASNTLSDVIPGATLTLRGEDAAQSVHIGVTRDAASVQDKVKAFISGYNKLVDFVGAQREAALKGNASVSRNPMVQGLHQELRTALLGEHGSGTVTRLAGVGVGFDRTGHMTLDESTFSDAVADDPSSVTELFSGTDADADVGAFDALTSLIKGYTGSDGLVRSVRDRLSDQYDQMTSRIDRLDAQLLIRRNTLQKEFIAADQIMQRLQSQSGSLSALSNQYRLF